ncbi:amidase, partial [bacterium]|nr:amidase [bacterium]
MLRIPNAEKIIGLHFTNQQRELMLGPLEENLNNYEGIRKLQLSHDVPAALLFNPIPIGMELNSIRKPFKLTPPVHIDVPNNLEDLAFYSIGQLAALIKSQKITSEQLTKMFLNRLEKYGPKLECVVTLTRDLALLQARQADKEISGGKYRGLLHGIPYGVKDVFSTSRIRTTFGATPYKDQIIDEDATVI